MHEAASKLESARSPRRSEPALGWNLKVHWLKTIRCMAKLEVAVRVEIGGRTCTFRRQ
jgi:hypothetical protein